MSPAVSIIIPCYNHPDFLQTCLESVRAQDFPDWEAIVVDDASSDLAIDQVVRQQADKRLRFIRHDRNRGQGAARNTAIRSATADLILPLDADDYLAKTFLERTVSAVLAQPELDVVFTDMCLFGAYDQIVKFSIRTTRDMLQVQWIPGAGALMRKRLWSEVGGYCELFALRGNEDWDFWLGAITKSLRLKHISETLYFYRQHSNSMMTSSLPDRDFQTRKIMYARHAELYKQYDVGTNFLADGYLNSVKSAYNRRNRLRTLQLAVLGLQYGVNRKLFLKFLILALSPELLQNTWRRLKRGG